MREQGTITLDATAGTGYSCDFVAPGPTLTGACSSVAQTGGGHVVDLKLKTGSVYEIVVFQAERHTTESNYTLTLSNFSGTRSVCSAVCGDGIVTAGEACDRGAAMNTGAYGTCNANCALGPGCGDGIKNGTEQCDDGKNDGSYGNCAPGCALGPRCGDMIVQTGAGEVCDAGAQNQPVATAYGKNVCTALCKPAPCCGDKAVDANEGCDDGVNSGQPGSCTTDCKMYVPIPSCGDGTVQPPEVCDDGSNNGLMTSKCDVHCKLKCGDGFKDPGEACDNGVNDGSYGTCNKDCAPAPHSGDSAEDGPETIDH